MLLATIVFLNTLPVWLFKETQHTSHASRELKLNQQNLVLKIKAYLRYFSQNKELRSWLMVLITFKVADGLAGPLLKPLMVDMGLSFTQIGVYITMLGAVAALAGAAIAGGVLKYFSRPAALIGFSVFKIMSLGAYTYLAYAYEQKNSVECLGYIYSQCFRRCILGNAIGGYVDSGYALQSKRICGNRLYLSGFSHGDC